MKTNENRVSPRNKPYGFLKEAKLLIQHGKEKLLSDAEIRLILTVQDFKWGEELPFPSNARVATVMGCSERKVQMVSKKLADRGLLKRPAGGRRPYWDFRMLFQLLEGYAESPKDHVEVNTNETPQHFGVTPKRFAETPQYSSPEVRAERNREIKKERKSIKKKEKFSSSTDDEKYTYDESCFWVYPRS